MAKEPVISFINADNAANLSTTGWQVGVVKADSESPVLNLQIWNSKGSSEEASNAQGCVLYILDKNEMKTEKIVDEGWLKAQCVSAGQTKFTTIDADTELTIQATGMEAGEISGAVNTGLETDTANFALVKAKFAIPANAPHGEHPFYIVVKFYYV